MASLVTITINGDEETAAKLVERVPQLSEALRYTINVLATKFVGIVKGDKLSGQLLGEISGHLKGSIHADYATEGSRSAEATIIAGGTNVEYARVHEFGFHGVETVKEHMRRITKVYGRLVTSHQILVSQFTRRVDIPEKRYMRGTLEEMAPEIIERMRAAVGQAADIHK